ncbi:MAG TPA: hypothetical protein VFS91_01515 [Nitrobacter sp.]|nr:hypothetical protein [Nitrobacter sp.]
MPAFIPFHETKRYLGEAAINFTTHDFKAMLTNSAPDLAVYSLKSDITEIAPGNGYTAGGVLMTSVTWSETSSGSGIWRWNMADFSWTASGGNMATFQYIVWYDDTSVSPLKPLIGYVDYGSGLILTNGSTFLPDIGVNGVLEF